MLKKWFLGRAKAPRGAKVWIFPYGGSTYASVKD